MVSESAPGQTGARLPHSLGSTVLLGAGAARWAQGTSVGEADGPGGWLFPSRARMWPSQAGAVAASSASA